MIVRVEAATRRRIMLDLVGLYVLSILSYVATTKDVTPTLESWIPGALAKASPCVVLAVGVGWETARSKLVALAFLLSAVGDFLLAHHDASGKEASFLGGLVSFLIAQWVYTYCFSRGKERSDEEESGQGTLVSSALCYAYAGGLYSRLLTSIESGLEIPVLVYCISIATTLSSSVGVLLGDMKSVGKKVTAEAVLGVAGAALFVVSDTCLALQMFLGPVVPHPRLVIMSTYFGAQLCLAIALGDV